jgi:uncharacterized lipoprotein YehR (DUF1307 family)
MKLSLKTAVAVFSIFLVTIISSCKKETEFWSTKAEGTILQQGGTTYQYGSHVLKSENDETIYALESDEINLDNHLNKKVEIKGHKVKGYPVSGGPELIRVTKVK